jgi:PAS domain S-box-containing protein
VKPRDGDRPSEPNGSPTVLQQTEDLLDLAQEAGQLGLFEWRVAAGTLHLSPKFLSLYGLTEFDGRYDSWLKCIFREDVPRIVDLMDNAFAERARRSQAEFRILRSIDGELRWIEARNVIFYDGEGHPVRVVGVNVDVTERKRALAHLRAFAETLEDRVRERTRELEAEHEARERAEDALHQAHKMEAIGQLTGGVAHDFNNLLMIILGNLEIVQRNTEPALGSASRQKRAIGNAMKGARRAATLTQRLLAFSRRQALDPKLLDVNRFIAREVEFFQRTLGETVEIEAVGGAGLWQVEVDVSQLETALLNLAVNARDAMPDGGKLTIETSNASLDEDYCRANPEVLRGQYVLISMTDNGSGMAKETIDRAFEPFYTTKAVGQGTGLGLSQVYGFIKQSGGHVKIYSEIGEGTTVRIYLPRVAGAADAAHEEEEAGEPAQGDGGETILVVEDDEDVRAYLIETLRDLNYRALRAIDSVSALGLLEQTDIRIDLLLTDVVLPGMNGRELAKRAQNIRPGLKVLFMTGYSRNAIDHQGRLDPDVELIQKPITQDRLAARIRNLLDASPKKGRT